MVRHGAVGDAVPQQGSGPGATTTLAGGGKVLGVKPNPGNWVHTQCGTTVQGHVHGDHTDKKDTTERGQKCRRGVVSCNASKVKGK